MRNLFAVSFYCFFFLFTCNTSFAYHTNKELIEKHLGVNAYTIDSEAAAMVLLEKTTVNITPRLGIYSQTKTVHKIIKILKNSGIEAANIVVTCPGDDADNYVANISGTTYNLKQDKVVGSVLDKKDIYKKRMNNRDFEVSFSLPSVKEGSVIEYTYDLVTPFSHPIVTWYIQEEYPKLLSEFELVNPSKFEFTSISYVRNTLKHYSSEEDALAGPDTFCLVAGKSPDNDAAYSSCWLKKNIDAEKTEPYVQNIYNNLERLEVQVTGYMTPNGMEHTYNSWKKINEHYWETKNFRKEVNGKNRFLDAVVDSLTGKSAPSIVNAKNIFSYVRSEFTCDPNKTYVPEKSLLNVFENKSGTIAELNLLLTAMLKHAGFDASPLVLGTTALISEVEVFPVLDRFNYLACAVVIDGNRVLLDASDKNNCFGLLPSYCYNGYAWMPGDKGAGILLTHDMITDRSMTGVKIFDFTDSSAKVEITEKLGLVTSAELRKKTASGNTREQQYLMEPEKNFGAELDILESKIENIDAPDLNLVFKYVCSMKFDKKVNVFYFNSLFVKLFDTNPFNSAERKLPVEFPCKTDFNYYMTIILPPGTEPDSFPKPLKITYDSSLIFTKTFGFFDEMHAVNVRANFLVNSTEYGKNEYKQVRYFFEKLIEANEQRLSVRKKAK